MANVPVRYGVEGDREVEEAFRRLEAAGERFGASVAEAGTRGEAGLKATSEALAKVERAFEEAAATARGATDQIAAGAKKAGDASAEAADKAAVLGTRIGGFVATAAIAGATSLAAFAAKGFDLARSLKDLADQTGISAETLQAWQFGLGRAGVSAQSFSQALLQLTRAAGQAAEGNERAIQSFARIGVEIRDATGRVKDGDVIFRDVADGLARLPTAQERAAAGARLLGTAWRDLVPNLERGAAGLAQFEEDAIRAGRAISAAQVAEIDKLSKEWNGLWNRANERALRFAAEIAPLLSYVLGSGKTAIPPVDFALAMLGGGERDKLADTAAEIEKVTREISRLERAMHEMSRRNPRFIESTFGPDALPRMAAEVAALRAQLEALAEVKLKLVSDVALARAPGVTLSDPFPFETPGAPKPPDPPPGSTGGGGGGRGGPDPRASWEAARRAVDEYVESLEREGRLSALAARERAVETAGLKAEELAQRELNEAKKAGIALDQDYVAGRRAAAETLARGNFDAEEARRDAERAAQEQDRAREQQMQAEMRRWERAADRMQDVLADAIYTGLKDGTLSWSSLAQGLGDVMRRQIAESLAAGVTLPIRAVFDQVAGGFGLGGFAGPGGAAGGSAGGYSGGAGGYSGGFGSLFGGSSPFGFLSQPIFGPSAAAYEGVIPGMTGAEAARYFGDPTGGSLGGMTWGQGLGGLGMIGMGANTLARGGGSAGSLVSGGASILGGGLGLAGAMGMLGAWAGPAGMLLGVAGGLLGSLMAPDRPRPQATANLLIDPTGDPWSIARSALAQNRDGGNASGVTGGADQVATRIERALWGIGARPGAGFQGGYLLNSQGNTTGDQWIVGLGQYRQPGGVEIANGLSGEQAAARLVNEIFRRAAEDGALVDDASGYFSATIVRALRNIDVSDQQALEDAIRTARTFDELMETGRAADTVRDALEQLREEFRGLEFDAGRLGLDLDALRDAQRLAERGQWDEFSRGIGDTLLGLDDPAGLALARNDRWRQEQLDAVQAYLDEGVASEAEAASRRLEIQRIHGENAVRIEAEYRGLVADQTVSGLQDLYRRLTYGDLSGASPTAALAGAQGAFGQSFAAALDPGASQSEIAEFQNAAAQYAQLALQAHGTGGDFRAINEAVTAAVAAVTAAQGGTLPAGAGGTLPAANSDDPQIAALLDRIDRLLARLPLPA